MQIPKLWKDAGGSFLVAPRTMGKEEAHLWKEKLLRGGRGGLKASVTSLGVLIWSDLTLFSCELGKNLTRR